MYAPSLSPSASTTATEVGISELALAWISPGPPNGTPRTIVLYSAPMLFQNRIWTSSGVPRKNQM